MKERAAEDQLKLLALADWDHFAPNIVCLKAVRGCSAFGLRSQCGVGLDEWGKHLINLFIVHQK